MDVIERVKKERLSYLEKNALLDLGEAVIKNERQPIKGIIVEAGCALGGSSLVIASLKNKERSFFIYDVFGMIPPPSDQDGEDVHERFKVIKEGKARGLGKDDDYYGYEENLYDRVLKTFRHFGLEASENNIYLVKGLYQDTLKINSPVALAHIDCDWYDSVLTCLKKIEPFLVTGGTLIIDDYYHWSGCRKAVDEFFKDRRGGYLFTKKSRLHIVKK